MKTLFAFLLIVAASSAQATGAREFGIFIGGGLTKNFASVQQPGVNASLGGWGNSVEAGLDVPFSDNFGLALSLDLGQKELRNNSQSSTYLDDTKINTRAARGLFFFKSFYAGGSYQMAGVDLTTISTTSGSSSAHMDLNGSSYFVGYSIMYKNLLRANIEGESSTYSSAGFSYTDYSVGLKLQLTIAGLLDHN